MRQSRHWSGSLLCLLFAASCGTDGGVESPVPAYNVNYSCNVELVNAMLQQTDVPDLSTPGGYVLVSDWTTLASNIGVGGLLLYHSPTDNAYFAYDLACPYCYSHQTMERLMMKDGLTAKCGVCDSEFGAICWGSPAPTAGVANRESLPLRQYKAHISGTTLYVSTR